MGHAHWVSANITPVLASAAKDMNFWIVFHMMCMCVLCIMLGCLVGSLLRIYQGAGGERDLGKDKV